MSRNVSTFATTILRPQLLSKFSVLMPAIGINPIIVESTTYPMPKLDEATFHWRGRQYFAPTKVLYSTGIWQFTVPEDITGSTYKKLIAVLYNQLSQDPDAPTVFDVIIYPTSGYGLHLSADLPLFGTQSLINYELNNPIMGVKLNDCWIKDISEPQLNATDPTVAMKWTVSLRYSSLSLIEGYGKNADDANAAFDNIKAETKKLSSKVKKFFNKKKDK